MSSTEGEVIDGVPSFKLVDEDCARRSLMEFIPWASPKYKAPLHLIALVDAFERAARGVPQQVVCHAPPRHGKSETMIHALVWALWRNPHLRFSYSTYGASLSRKMSRKARQLAQRVGIEFASSKLDEWVTTAGGGCIFSGVDGPLTGSGVDIAIIDDPVKSRLEAESALKRDRVWDWFNDVLSTRIEGYNPEQGQTGNGSMFVFMTRWHPDDLSGRLLKEGNWQSIHLPALNDNGEALWPARWPAEALLKRKARVGLYTWASLFQGEPRPRGGAVFTGVTTYDALPAVGRRAFGVDLAYSKKTSADYSVAVEMMATNIGTKDKSDVHYFVVSVVRKQCTAPEFKLVCGEMAGRAPGAQWRWYAFGTELGVADMMRPAVNIKAIAAKGDKFVRSLKYAAAWNAGRVHLPLRAPWLDQFLSEHAGFTGNNDDHDDTVDAAVAAFDELESGATVITSPVQTGSRSGLAASSM